MIKNKEKFNDFLDVMQVVITLVSIIILTIFFRMYTTSIRYLFLLVDFCLIMSLSKSLKSFNIKKQDERVIKYSKGKIESKFIPKVRV